jgi:membrane protein DedA with SNARE-associated domain
LENWITDIMNDFGYMGILLIMLLENIFPPIPSEVTLTFGGFMTTYTNLNVIGVIIYSTIGSVVGAIILYGIGALLDVSKAERIVDKWGHILRLSKKDIHTANDWFHKYGVWAVFFCRLIPLIRSLISIPAGMSRMSFGLFLVFTAAGSFIWNVILVNIGAGLGSSWESIIGYMEVYSSVLYAFLALLVILFVILFVKKRVAKH